MMTTTSFNSVVQLEANGERSWRATEKDAIRAALVDHYGADVDGAALTPPHDPAALRARLREVAPQLTGLTDRIRSEFDVSEACAVLVPELGLRGLGIDDKRKCVFALAVLLGDPTATIPFDQVMWDVKNRGDEASGHTSFSENDLKAGYHTDNGALPIPEHFFLLYAVRAADCGGGLSLLRDGRVLKSHLEETPEGRAAVRLFTEMDWPRRIPEEFKKYADIAADGYLFAPVLAEKPMWRWRNNGIRRGIAAHPEYQTPEVRQAFDIMLEQLANGPDEIRLAIPTDGILIIDNHITLHGRTAFTDPERHLLRLRFHEPATAETG
ncbi:TauD/TfdA family dioxygenase [Pseudonocardia bannensis]|uniref:TauD/TfdA family dioxygenase n=1 Tax=Pseudonocardia bannensis TaxID=630973 RepID=A0A848DN29_9PSEU|nr:TauD/TfdA family dioxygenase [Pseudonocardia bannensis]NMH94210.1 TauD/TfdA family dioxygenase [Pseudonocardia bannensis]